MKRYFNKTFFIVFLTAACLQFLVFLRLFISDSGPHLLPVLQWVYMPFGLIVIFLGGLSGCEGWIAGIYVGIPLGIVVYSFLLGLLISRFSVKTAQRAACKADQSDKSDSLDGDADHSSA